MNRASPAEKAGLKTGDVITAINDKPVQDSKAAMTIIASLKPGSDAKFSLIRSQKEVTVNVTIGKRPKLPRQNIKE